MQTYTVRYRKLGTGLSDFLFGWLTWRTIKGVTESGEKITPSGDIVIGKWFRRRDKNIIEIPYDGVIFDFDDDYLKELDKICKRKKEQAEINRMKGLDQQQSA